MTDVAEIDTVTFMKLSLLRVRRFQSVVWEFYKKHKRNLPWRETRDPYKILVSEVMLQQTQVERVIPKYREWVKRFPNPRTLVNAKVSEVLRVWSGLGYNRRALYLKRAAEIIMKEHRGAVPRDVEALDALPGIGRDTASAVLAFAWNEPTVFIETNIRTVFLHHFFPKRKKVRDGEILKLTAQTLPTKAPLRSDLSPDPRSDLGESQPWSVREWYNALMDYGAHLKDTVGNPNARSAHYAKQEKFIGSRRQLRGEILRKAATQKFVSRKDVISKELSVAHIFMELVREGFLKKTGKMFTLA